MAEVRLFIHREGLYFSKSAQVFCDPTEAFEYGISSHEPAFPVDYEEVPLNKATDTRAHDRRLYGILARRYFGKFGVRLQDSAPVTGHGFNPKSFVPNSISRADVEAWLDRDDIALHENEARRQKGFYLKSAGPASSFKACGKTWREVATALELI